MRVLVVDDEAPARERLKSLLTALPGVECVGEAGDGAAALSAAREQNPDVVLLDIRMPGMDGMAAAHELAQLTPAPAVIFTTAYSEHALEAFDAQALDYLLKPVRRERLQRALERAHGRGGEKSEVGDEAYLLSRLHGRELRVPVAEVRYFQAADKYVSAYYMDNGETIEAILEESLKSLEDRFGEALVRIHRNALVSRNYLRGIEQRADGVHVALLSGVEGRPEISRRHVAEIRRLLKGE